MGCGTGILSLFAARAGARRVIGVEKSDFAVLARRVVLDNQLSHVVTIVRGKVYSCQRTFVKLHSTQRRSLLGLLLVES